jgi:uncharacterized repeat protein (TIGR03803 family)
MTGEGRYPDGALLEGSDGVLYGTTSTGGSNDAGTIFKLKKDGTGYIVLHEFTGSAEDGKTPRGGFVEGHDGALYGTTESGGANDDGTAFRLNKDGSGYELLRRFTHTAGDGQNPIAALLKASDGALYGTTQGGGDLGFGTIFVLRPRAPFLSLAAVQPNGQFRFTLIGSPGYSYTIQASTDLQSWTSLTNFVSATGTNQFGDAEAPSFKWRFYRAVTL